MLENFLNFLENENYPLIKGEKEKFYELNSLESQLNTAINDVESSFSKNIERFANSLQDKIEKLKQEGNILLNQVIDEKFLDINNNQEEMINELDDLQEKIGDAEDLATKFGDYEEILRMTTNNQYNTLEKAREELNLRLILWQSLKEWKILVEKWKILSFADIDVKEIASKSEYFTRIVNRCEKNMVNNEVVQTLKNMVYEFKETTPVIIALRSEYLKPIHWDKIFQLIGGEIPIDDPDFTLEALMKLSVIKHQEEIIEISVTATQEFELNKQLVNIENFWDQYDLILNFYKDSSDMMVLTQIEEIFNDLDESLANMNNLLANKYIKSMRKRAEGFYKNLLTLQDIIDKWVECQKKWMYFETIFRNSDIKIQLHHEAQLFDSVDKFLKNLSKKVALQPKAMKVIKMQNVIENLVKINEIMDSIEKQLDEYLDMKRQIFPRFYFISNDELIEILSKGNDINVIERTLRKCFENIASIDVKDKVITAMISAELEQIQLNKASLVIRSNVEIWMDNLQKIMAERIKREIRIGLTNFFQNVQKTRNEWILNHPGQVVSVVSSISWCLSTEEAIIQQFDKVGILNEWYNLNLDQLFQLTQLIRKNLSSLHRKIVVALLTTEVHSRDILENLFQEEIQNINEFVWQKQLRYYWDEDNEACYIKQVYSNLNYGY